MYNLRRMQKKKPSIIVQRQHLYTETGFVYCHLIILVVVSLVYHDEIKTFSISVLLELSDRMTENLVNPIGIVGRTVGSYFHKLPI